MPNTVHRDHDHLRDTIKRAEEISERTRGDTAEALHAAGIDPEILAVIEKDRQVSEEEADDDAEKKHVARRDDEQLEDDADTQARNIDSVDTDLDADKISDKSGDMPGVEGSTHLTAAEPAPASDVPVPSRAEAIPQPDFNPEANRAAAPQIQPGAAMPQNPYTGMGYTPTSALHGPINPSPFLGGVSPTPPPTVEDYNSQMMQQPRTVQHIPVAGNATQYDMNTAPNKEELAELVYQALQDGDSGDDPYGDMPRIEGGGEVTTNPDDPEHVLEIKNLAKDYVGTKMEYVWGGGHGSEPGPTQGVSDGGGAADAHGDYDKIGLDCSGLARDFYYNAYGVDIGAGSAADQYNSGQPVSASEARPGDIFFPDSAGRPPQHVQIYIGDGQVLEAQQSGTRLMVSPIESGEFRRFVQ